MNIRPATKADAEAGSALLRRSIAELCGDDHGFDPAAIAAWTANKTPENWIAWTRQPGAAFCVAEDGGALVGVGLMTARGEILLNYVAPDARFAGVSKAMLAHMETAARAAGLARCALESTRTARRFYRSMGYEPVEGAGADRLTMWKTIAPA